MRKARPHLNFDALLQNVKVLPIHVNVRASVLVTRISLPLIAETIAGLADYGIGEIRMSPLVRRGRAIQNWDELAVSKEQYIEALAVGQGVAVRRGVHLCELRSVADSALAIVKTDGRLYRGDANGSLPVGSIWNHRDVNELARVLWSRQLKSYAVLR